MEPRVNRDLTVTADAIKNFIRDRTSNAPLGRRKANSCHTGAAIARNHHHCPPAGSQIAIEIPANGYGSITDLVP